MEKTQLAVAALKNGTVIDHIPADALFKAVQILGIENLGVSVTIGNNLPSKQLGKKGIIKVADTEFDQQTISRIALIAPTAVINIIRDYNVVSKLPVVLPEVITGIVECPNPKCVTRNQPIPSRFVAIDTDPIRLRCHYCEHDVQAPEIHII